VSSPHRDAHDYALNYMRQYHRANIITSDQAIAEFRTLAAGAEAQGAVADETARGSHQRPSYTEWRRAARSA
jgi:hypothetical protein